jgi:hypothetical protein
MNLILLLGTFAICRLDSGDPVPAWAQGEFVSITRTNDELTIVCIQDDVPAGIHCDLGWRCLRPDGRFDLTEVGVIASLAKPLADNGVSVFVIGTFDTDYLLVKESRLSDAVVALEQSGHSVRGE